MKFIVSSSMTRKYIFEERVKRTEKKRTEAPPLPPGVIASDFAGCDLEKSFGKHPCTVDPAWVVPKFESTLMLREEELIARWESRCTLYRKGNRAVPPGERVKTRGGRTAAEEQLLDLYDRNLEVLQLLQKALGILLYTAIFPHDYDRDAFVGMHKLNSEQDVRTYIEELICLSTEAGYSWLEDLEDTPPNLPVE